MWWITCESDDGYDSAMAGWFEVFTWHGRSKRGNKRTGLTCLTMEISLGRKENPHHPPFPRGRDSFLALKKRGRGTYFTMSWDPKQYRVFAEERLQPAIDLLGRINLAKPRLIYDLGCGSGDVTALIQAKWPEAEVIGIDSSPDMLTKAMEKYPGISWRQADLSDWCSDFSPDLIFSNAALHWLPGHEKLFPRLLSQLTVGGCLAVQMPNNFSASSHLAVRETICSGPWRSMIETQSVMASILPPESYVRLLADAGLEGEIWETDYYHLLRGDDPVLEWIKGSTLRPLLALLPSEWEKPFLNDCAERLRRFYPKENDEMTIFRFRRLFILCQMTEESPKFMHKQEKTARMG